MGRTYRKRKKRIKNSSPTTSSSSNPTIDYRKIQSLFQWLRRSTDNSGQTQRSLTAAKLRPAVFAATGRGLQCRSDGVAVGDLLVSIPIDLLVTTKTVLTVSDVPLDAKHSSELTDIELLTAFVYWERRKGAASDWHEYFQSLPDGFDELPYVWTDLVAICRSTPASLAAKLLSAREVYRKSMASVFRALNVCHNTVDDNHEDNNKQLFRWSYGAVNTRCVHLDTVECPNTCALAPFLDLLNHSSAAKVRVQYSADTQRYEIYSLSAYNRYDQVFINYGNHCNRDLFLNYGFVDNMANNLIPISFKSVFSELATDPRVTRRLNVLLKIGFVDKATTFWIQYESIDWRLDTALRLLSSNRWPTERWALKQWIYSGSVELDGSAEELYAYGDYKRRLLTSLSTEYDMKAVDRFECQCLRQLLTDEFEILSHHLCD